MATLHLVNRAAALESCLGVAAEDDVILLIEDGVYAGAMPDAGRGLHAIDLDIQARGLGKRMHERVVVVAYAEFVRLAEQHNPIVTWR